MCVCPQSLSCVQIFATPGAVAHQAPRSMGFSRQEYWSGLPFPSPGELPNPGIEPGSPVLQANFLPSEPLAPLPRKRFLPPIFLFLKSSSLEKSSKHNVKLLSRVQLFVTPWTVACQAPLSMGFPRQEHWSGLPFASPGDLPEPGIEPRSPALQADSLPSEPLGKPYFMCVLCIPFVD